MSRRRPYKNHKRGDGPFVKLDRWLTKSAEWRNLSAVARALYLEMKERYNGSNNGDIRLSHREAAIALNLHRNTVGRYFNELEGAGFIEMVEGPYLGPAGIGLTAKWLLTELPGPDGQPARKTFMKQSRK